MAEHTEKPYLCVTLLTISQKSTQLILEIVKTDARTEWLKTKTQFTTILDHEDGVKVEIIAKELAKRKEIKEPTRYEITRYALLGLLKAFKGEQPFNGQPPITSNPLSS